MGRLFSDETLAPLRERLDAIMAGTHAVPGLFFQPDSATGRYEDLSFGAGWQGPSPHYRKIEKLELDPLFAAFIANGAFEAIARGWIEGPIALYRAVLFTKSARGGTALPWHQDGGRFWGVDRAPTLQIWTALDDCPRESGCLEVLPGSHALGLATPEGGTVPVAKLAAADAESRALALPARAGEVLLVHNHLWHRSGVNSTGRPRRTLSVCLMSAATRCLRKKRAPRRFPVIFP